MEMTHFYYRSGGQHVSPHIFPESLRCVNTHTHTHTRPCADPLERSGCIPHRRLVASHYVAAHTSYFMYSWTLTRAVMSIMTCMRVLCHSDRGVETPSSSLSVTSKGVNILLDVLCGKKFCPEIRESECCFGGFYHDCCSAYVLSYRSSLDYQIPVFN